MTLLLEPAELAESRNKNVLGKAVHPAALKRLHELFPLAHVHIRHAEYPVELPYGTQRMDSRHYAQPEHETYVIIDLTGEGRPGTGDKAIGLATCHPLDNFDRRKGIKLAFRRALEQARRHSQNPFHTGGPR